MDPDFDPAEIVEELEPDDMLTLIYTSGTTGPPKGVQLTHRNLMALTGGVEDIVDFPERGAKVISWLPAAHIAERGAHYYLPVNRGRRGHDLPGPPQDRRVPGGREADLVLLGARGSGRRSRPGSRRAWPSSRTSSASRPQRAIAAGIQKVRLEQAGEEVPEELAAGVAQAEEQMFSQLRAQIGLDEVVAVNSGAAPCPVEVLEFFHAIGLPVGELWGMSETCGVDHLQPARRGQDRHGRASGARRRGEARRGRRDPLQGPLGDARLPQHAGEERRDLRGRRLAAHRRHRRAGRGRLPEDRRPQEGADHQRGRQEHVAGQHRVPPEDRQPADRPGGRDRRPAVPTTSR